MFVIRQQSAAEYHLWLISKAQILFWIKRCHSLCLIRNHRHLKREPRQCLQTRGRYCGRGARGKPSFLCPWQNPPGKGSPSHFILTPWSLGKKLSEVISRCFERALEALCWPDSARTPTHVCNSSKERKPLCSSKQGSTCHCVPLGRTERRSSWKENSEPQSVENWDKQYLGY